jgi:hypothetical protein
VLRIRSIYLVKISEEEKLSEYTKIRDGCIEVGCRFL